MKPFFVPWFSSGILACIFVWQAEAKVDGDRLSTEVNFEPPVFKKSRLAPGYDRVEMKHAVSVGEPGFPVLPFKRAMLLVPDGQSIKDLEIVPGKRIEIPGGFLIEPGQSPRPLNNVGVRPLDLPDARIYGADAAYPKPSVRISSIQRKSGYSIAAIAVCPVEYNPRKGTLAYYESLTLVLNLAAKNNARSGAQQKNLALRRMTPKTRIRDEERIEGLIDNKEDFPAARAMALRGIQSQPLTLGPIPAGQFDYVIITCGSFQSAFEPLRDYRAQHGLPATIVTTEWIYTNYAGTRPSGGQDDATRIRNFITDAYHQWGARFVLLGGSGHGNPGVQPIIPVRGLSDPATGADPTQSFRDDHIAADLYYACLDGTFDGNGNGIYGEPDDGEDGGEVDLLSEVDVGRAPVSTQQEAQNFVAKTLQYETTPDSDPVLGNNYTLGVNFLGVDIDAATYSTAFMEEVRLGSDSGLVTQGFLSNPERALDAKTLYDRPGYFWSGSNLLQVINHGVHVLNYDGHGINYSDMRLVPSNLPTITNHNPFIVFSGACYSAAFDNRKSDGTYAAGNSIAEQMITMADGGAVAYVGNSRFGWDYSTEFFNRTFWDVLFGQGIHELGTMNQRSKEMTLPYFYFPLMRWVYLDQNLLGDPALGVHVPDRLILEPVSNSVHYHGPGQGIDLTLGMAAFNQDAHQVSVTLRSADTNVIVTQGTAQYGEVPKGQMLGNPDAFSFQLATTVPLPYTTEILATITSTAYTNQKPVWVTISGPESPPVLYFFLFENNAPNGYASSNARHVGLYIDTSIPNPGMSGGGLMQFSNDNINWSAPEPLVQTKVDWELSPGDGIKIVYARVADEQGNWSAVNSRPIILDTAPPTGTIEVQSLAGSTVTLALTATDVTSGVQRMKFSFDGKMWLPDVPFAATYDLMLPTNSIDIVHVKFRDAANNWSDDYAASIRTFQNGPSLAAQLQPSGKVTLVLSVKTSVKYQLESSADLTNWELIGTPFVADSPWVTQEVEGRSITQFFRLAEVH